MRDLLDAAESDWELFAGKDFGRHLKTLGDRKAAGRRTA
jgi:hypothetical protein